MARDKPQRMTERTWLILPDQHQAIAHWIGEHRTMEFRLFEMPDYPPVVDFDAPWSIEGEMDYVGQILWRTNPQGARTSPGELRTVFQAVRALGSGYFETEKTPLPKGAFELPR